MYLHNLIAALFCLVFFFFISSVEIVNHIPRRIYFDKTIKLAVKNAIHCFGQSCTESHVYADASVFQRVPVKFRICRHVRRKVIGEHAVPVGVIVPAYRVAPIVKMCPCAVK